MDTTTHLNGLSDRRDSERVPAFIEIASSSRAFHAHRTLDVSGGGLLIELAEGSPLPPLGQPLSFQLHLADVQLTVLAVVVRHVVVDEHAAIGVKLLGLPRARELLTCPATGPETERVPSRWSDVDAQILHAAL